MLTPTMINLFVIVHKFARSDIIPKDAYLNLNISDRFLPIKTLPKITPSSFRIQNYISKLQRKVLLICPCLATLRKFY